MGQHTGKNRINIPPGIISRYSVRSVHFFLGEILPEFIGKLKLYKTNMGIDQVQRTLTLFGGDIVQQWLMHPGDLIQVFDMESVCKSTGKPCLSMDDHPYLKQYFRSRLLTNILMKHHVILNKSRNIIFDSRGSFP